MKKLFLLAAFFILYANAYSQYSTQIDIFNSNCYVNEKIILISQIESQQIDFVIVTLCNNTIISRIINYDNVDIDSNASLEAQTIFTDTSNQNYEFIIRSKDNKENLYRLIKTNSKNAVLYKFVDKNKNMINISDEFFHFISNDNNLQISKKKDFVCSRIQLIDLRGSIINQFNYNNSFYYFDISQLAAGTYFVIFVVEDQEYMKKIIVN